MSHVCALARDELVVKGGTEGTTLKREKRGQQNEGVDKPSIINKNGRRHLESMGRDITLPANIRY